MESKKNDWKECARDYFFNSHFTIEQIANLTEVSRQSISSYLKNLPDYQEERKSRKADNAIRRKEYKKEKNRTYRAMGAVTADTMRREHDVAALILSREKYH